jgi:hypothetical protein
MTMEREMKLTTFAATGYRHALEQAVPAGQRVTAVVRNPKKLSGEWIRQLRPGGNDTAAGPLSLRQAADLPAAIAMTISVVRAFPPIPHDPLFTSSIVTQVTPRMFSPSIETIASVNFSMISFFCFGVNTSSIK